MDTSNLTSPKPKLSSCHKSGNNLMLLDAQAPVEKNLVLRTVYLSGIDLDIQRSRFLSIFRKSKFAKSLEIMIFKVDKDGESLGQVKLILVSKEQASKFLKEMDLMVFGKETVACIEKSTDQMEFLLSKERQMEIKKIERKFKKLLKFPKTLSTETFKSLLENITCGVDVACKDLKKSCISENSNNSTDSSEHEYM
jgi:hypothetical protein